jgi:hypothetical protein
MRPEGAVAETLGAPGTSPATTDPDTAGDPVPASFVALTLNV